MQISYSNKTDSLTTIFTVVTIYEKPYLKCTIINYLYKLIIL